MYLMMKDYACGARNCDVYNVFENVNRVMDATVHHAEDYMTLFIRCKGLEREKMRLICALILI